MHAFSCHPGFGPIVAAVGIVLLSFVSEDAATFSSALLLFGGPIDWRLGFLSCFAGIWFGDLGLYGIARSLGPALLRNRFVRKRVNASAIEKARQAFVQRGALALLASRFVPGTRLPTYLAAGAFSLPAWRFAGVTAAAALIWIGAIFGLTAWFGAGAQAVVGTVRLKLVAAVMSAVALGAMIFIAQKLDWKKTFRPLVTAVRRWRRWEFWPAQIFYIPVAMHYVWLGFRYRSFSLPGIANPGLESGGFVGESKSRILRQLQEGCPEFVAEGFLLRGETVSDRLLAMHQLVREHGIEFPFILKPDLGQRGWGVRLVRDFGDGFDYLRECEAPVLLQRFATGPQEAGVFYFRRPGVERGQIFSITEKLFPSISGDGVRTIEELINADARAALISRTYLTRFADRRDEILPVGAALRLVESGNHAQGCVFQEGGHLWSEELERAIDEMSRSVPGFYIGRYDIRYADESEFRAGRNFQVVELNGSSSEATNIYDARMRLRSAYRILFRQWRLVFEIGAANRARGSVPPSLAQLWRDWRRYLSAAACYPLAS